MSSSAKPRMALPQPALALRWVALGILYLLLLAGPPAFFGDNPPVRVANAVALVSLLQEPPRRWLPLALLLWTCAVLARLVPARPDPVSAGACNVLEALLATA